MLYSLCILAHRYLSAAILDRFTVRIHAGLVVAAEEHVKLHPNSRRQIASGNFLKLWYVLRALDTRGSGYWRGSLEGLALLLGCGKSTIYQYLREGKIAGSFRRWKCQRGELRVALASLNKLAGKLNLGKDGWRPVGETTLAELLSKGLRPIATGILIQKLQLQARYAAWANLPPQIREKYKLPYPEEFFTGSTSSSHDLPSPQRSSRGRGLKCVLHVGRKRIFTTAGFIPQGVSQPKIAWERGRCDRTIQRHVAQLAMGHRQIVQSRATYEDVRMGLTFDMEVQPTPDLSLSHVQDGAGVLLESPGTVGKPHLSKVRLGRFFPYGGREWIYRCNLYQPQFRLRTMRAAFRDFSQQAASFDNDPPSAKGAEAKSFPQQADKDRQNP